MLHIPVSRWGEPYKSLDIDKVVHFATGESLAEVSRANDGLVERARYTVPTSRELEDREAREGVVWRVLPE